MRLLRLAGTYRICVTLRAGSERIDGQFKSRATAKIKANKSEGAPSGDGPPRRTRRRIVDLAAIVLVCVAPRPG